ncbi:family 2 encapsulin nanocompartment cargo protein terpene cyclase [Crossiella sp. CA-258035]|uniref:family 2 encapsulin nanocompartment cargo protein terpene cyclase n=1 Tax=Crossiella sp. CA-258035 TaxID=2981138 RepID=UPI0024BCBB95|nr:family 2 encapsulin nanocompartment cargo protein terpene cyclase [Crossiella sp. CA-258035]WHT18497.1 family 2 encapsulin nanocompartment cargo protein terpene cyclase [Crossiella sp. CA-258035]
MSEAVTPAPTRPAWLAGPSGLGTSAARVAAVFGQEPPPVAVAEPAPPPVPEPAASGDPAYAYRSWGEGNFSPVYVPVVERINPALGTEVDLRVVDWALACGFSEEESELMGKGGFGRLAMLTHPDSEDPDQLLISARLNAAWWAADDLYADSTEHGATPVELPGRLMLAMAAMDRVPDAREFTPPLEEKIAGERVLVALRSGIEHLAARSTPAVVQRVNYSTFAMFVSWTAYAAWRHTDSYPPAWEYLAARQHDNFYTSMTLIDAVGGYEVPANLYNAPEVREAAFQAGLASVLVNDLFSVAKDAADELPVCNMVLQIAADRGCSIEEATEVTVELHNEVVRDFEAGHRRLAAVPSPELQRFLRGLRAWMGGGFEWHHTNPRYRT